MTKAYVLNEETKAMTITGLMTNENLSWTPGADVVGFKLRWANIDFDKNEFNVVESNEVKSTKSQVPLNISLTFANPPTGSGVNVIVLVISFYQYVNGLDYTFMNSSYNVAQIIYILRKLERFVIGIRSHKAEGRSQKAAPPAFARWRSSRPRCSAPRP